MLYSISYANLMMLLSTIPQYESPAKDSEGKVSNAVEHVEEVDSMDAFLKLNIK